MTSQIPIDVNWPYGKGKSSYTISPYTLIHEIPNKPGCYIWLMRPRSRNEFLLAFDLFEHATLSATVRGNIRLTYQGELSKKSNYPEVIFDSDCESLFADMFFAVGYPLYIGISKNIKQRLNTHKIKFEEAHAKKTKDSARQNETERISNEIDSDEESSYFGGRLASAWKTLRSDCLYVKYVIPNKCRTCELANCDKACLESIMTQLRNVEYSANSLFNPVFGRR